MSIFLICVAVYMFIGAMTGFIFYRSLSRKCKTMRQFNYLDSIYDYNTWNLLDMMVLWLWPIVYILGTIEMIKRHLKKTKA